MTRVALDATPLLGTRTGVATFVAGLFRALADRDEPDISAYALSLRGFLRLRDVVPAGVACRARPAPAGVLTRLWSRADWPTAELLAGDVDVVHGTNYVVPPARRAGAVVSVYDLTALRYPEMVEPASRRYPQLVQRAAARGALVHVTAQAIGDEVVEMLGVPAERVRVVAGGIERAQPGDADRGRRIAGSESYVLAVGTVEPRKGFVDLVAAFERVACDDADAGLVIAGADGWGAAALARAWEESPVRRRIRRLGWVDDETKRDLLAGAAVLAMPSVYEGFGYPPLEAMAAGVPVVATSVGSLPEVLGDAARFVAPSDVDALAGALGAVLGDSAARASMRTAGFARVAQFTWTDAASAMARVYDEAAAR